MIDALLVVESSCMLSEDSFWAPSVREKFKVGFKVSLVMWRESNTALFTFSRGGSSDSWELGWIEGKSPDARLV